MKNDCVEEELMQKRYRYKHEPMNAQHAVQNVFSSLKGRSFRELMKTKNFYLLILFLVAVFTTLWMFIDPSLHTIVSETHKQISNIKNIPSNLKSSVKDLLDVDVRHFEHLGFGEDEFSSSYDADKVLKKDPVVVVPVEPSSYDRANSFLWSVKKYLPEKYVVFYDLGLGGKEAATVCQIHLIHVKEKMCYAINSELLNAGAQSSISS